MIKGRYVRGDDVYMIPFGEGMTKIEYVPIKNFTWEKPKFVEARTIREGSKKKNRDWILWSIPIASFLCGASFGSIIQRFYYAIPIFICTLGWTVLVVFANRRDK